jgi:chemotaxis response regulator CheB
VVFGMPKEAIKLGAAAAVVPLETMTHSILQALQALSTARRDASGG